MVEKLNTKYGTLEYSGPGWYKGGKCVGCNPHDLVWASKDAVWVDLEYTDEVNRMVDEGCPHSDDPVEVAAKPQACKTNSYGGFVRNLWERVKSIWS